MKVRCINNENRSNHLKLGEIYEAELIDHINGDKRWVVKGINSMSFYQHRFEVVNEDNIEKTFREVIADIKEGEIWETTRKDDAAYWGPIYINKFNNKICMTSNNHALQISEEDTFKLKRKEYTFEEAFKAYEEGKEIESCEVLTGCHPSKYKRIANKDAQWREESYSWDKRKYIGIPFYEVRGKWYINN